MAKPEQRQTPGGQGSSPLFIEIKTKPIKLYKTGPTEREDEMGERRLTQPPTILEKKRRGRESRENKE